MKVDPVFPVGPSVNLPRYKFIKRGKMIPVQDTLSLESVQPVQAESTYTDSSDGALFFALALLTLTVLFI